jgi:membrane protease YdiL (CAAX protease family)
MSIAAKIYILLIGVLLPALCIRSYFALKAGGRFPRKPAFFKNTLFSLGAILVLAIAVWRSFGLPIFPAYTIRLKDVAVGLGTIVVFVLAMYPRWKHKVIRSREKVFRRVPQDANEMGWWIAVSIAAGFAEEFAYRGVLFGILIYWVPNWWAAALLCALSFALAHAIQGWSGAAIIFVMAIIFQGIVLFTGTLYVAMAAHALYDVIAGFAYLRLYKQTTSQVSAAAPASVV